MDDTKVRALLAERGRGDVKNDKCAMLFVRLFKVCSHKQKHNLLPVRVFFYSDASAYRNVLWSLEPR